MACSWRTARKEASLFRRDPLHLLQRLWLTLLKLDGPCSGCAWCYFTLLSLLSPTPLALALSLVWCSVCEAHLCRRATDQWLGTRSRLESSWQWFHMIGGQELPYPPIECLVCPSMNLIDRQLFNFRFRRLVSSQDLSYLEGWSRVWLRPGYHQVLPEAFWHLQQA